MAQGSDVGVTARWAAAVRAVETEREDRLYADPWAAALAGEAGMAWVRERPAATLTTMVLRTRFFDDELRRAVDGGLGQVVLLAAGLDTRAFRLAWPVGTTVFELDRADVLEHKASVLAAAGATPTAERRVVATDLAGSAWVTALARAGFDAGAPAAFLAEGFVFYLPGPAVDALLGTLTSVAAPGSRLGFDIVNALVLTHPLTRGWVEMQAELGAPWLGTLEDPVSTLGGLGWDATLHQAGDPEADHGRWTLPHLPVDRPDLPHHWLVTATRRA